LVQEELAYDQHSLTIDEDNVEDRFNDDQRSAYESILNVVTNKECKLFFVYGSGGTSKTFVWTTFLSRLRGQSKIVLTVASSRITSLLLWAVESPIQDSRFRLIYTMNRFATSHNK
jgi:Cdc6-like AAA superfamily ATPase